jgi:hypothetical protein
MASLATQIWAASWSALFVIAGTVLSRDTEMVRQKKSGEVSI